MNRIVKKEKLSKEVFLFEVEAPYIAKERKAGQFIVLQLGGDFNERIPLTIADADEKKGTISLMFQAVGETTHLLARLNEGDYIANILGPLGTPTKIESNKRVVVVGGGIGIAPAYPIAKAFKEAGSDVTVIMGARNKDLIIFEEQMRSVDPDAILVTDDGSAGRKGLVTEPLKELCENEKIDIVVAIGPPMMMKFCALTTKPFNIHTLVSLNTIMIDGTGMCGGCRVTVDNKMKFVCVDGPEFDGHLVDWDNMLLRYGTYKQKEQNAHHKCHIDLQLEQGEA